MSLARAFLLVAVAALVGGASDPAPLPSAATPLCPGAQPQLFLSPMGEPFRPAAGGPLPVQAWLAGADSNHDGRLSEDEMVADADRFFTRLDTDGNGEITPDELTQYENHIAPEIRLYQSTAWPGSGPNEGKRRRADKPARGGKNDPYRGAQGAGRFTWLNIPEPVAAADLDMNRGVSREEFRTVARNRFRLLDKGGARALTLATLPPLPGQAVVCPPPEGKGARR